jgi:dethiobiotin synthetase
METPPYGARPSRVVAVVGTATEVGKTWVAVRLIEAWRRQSLRVAARKPVQSGVADHIEDDDAALLAVASGERSEQVCPAHRRYPLAMAPPMAADALGLPSITLAALVAETTWPDGCAVGLVETAGGVRSPQAHDADAAAVARSLCADAVLLVADAGLGTINGTRLAVEALEDAGLAGSIVVLNRFDEADDLHRRNRAWLEGRDGFAVFTSVPGDLYALATALAVPPLNAPGPLPAPDAEANDHLP